MQLSEFVTRQMSLMLVGRGTWDFIKMLPGACGDSSSLHMSHNMAAGPAMSSTKTIVEIVFRECFERERRC
jgi:hypothetical protein